MRSQDYNVYNLTQEDKLYPLGLTSIGTPKLILKGSLSENTFRKTAGVVGSRLISDYAKLILSMLIPELVKQEFTIISGFSYGVDAFAHRLAIENRGKTVAVVPGGIEQIIPKQNTRLYHEILEARGLIVSTHESKIPVKPWVFAERNRLLAGLSDILIIVEADINSGSLITANFGFELHKQVYFIPHRITDVNSRGVNQLYKKGGIPIVSVDPLILEYQLPLAKVEVTEDEERILEELRITPLTLDELMIKTQMPIHSVYKHLSTLELNGLIYQKGGYYYVY